MYYENIDCMKALYLILIGVCFFNPIASKSNVLEKKSLYEVTSITCSDECLKKKFVSDQQKKEVTVLILPISNGYTYAINGYSFLSTLEKELQKDTTVTMIPLPYKKLKGIPYQGIFSKKYCSAIIKKVTVDYILMSRFIPSPNSLTIGEDGNNWGYEIKIVNTITQEEKTVLKATHLKSFDVLENQIKLDYKEIIKKIVNETNSY